MEKFHDALNHRQKVVSREWRNEHDCRYAVNQHFISDMLLDFLKFNIALRFRCQRLIAIKRQVSQIWEQGPKVAVNVDVREYAVLAELVGALLVKRHKVALKVFWRKELVVNVFAEVDDSHNTAADYLLS